MDEHIQDLPLWNDPEAFSILESLCKKPIQFGATIAEQKRGIL